MLNTATGIDLGATGSYITIEGFEIHASYRVVELVGLLHHHPQLPDVRRPGQLFGLLPRWGELLLIQYNYYDRGDPDGSSQYGDEPTGGDGLRLIGNSHHNLIEGNTVTRCEHAGMASSYSSPTVYQSYNVWRGNTAYSNHTNFAMSDGLQRTVFEGNTGYYPGLVWTGGNGNCFQFSGLSCIVRFNTFYDDTATVYTARRWPALIGSGSGNGGSSSMQFNKIYNNTVYGETDQQEWSKAGWRTDNNTSATLTQNDNVFTNNIVAQTGDVQIDDVDAVRPLSTMNNRYTGNLLSGRGGSPASVRYEYLGAAVTWTLAEVKRARPLQWAASNTEGDPLVCQHTGAGAVQGLHAFPWQPRHRRRRASDDSYSGRQRVNRASGRCRLFL